MESVNVYDMNDTMRMLGSQDISEIFWLNDKVRGQIDEIINARPYSFTLESAADIFSLGYIYGKRAERSRKKKEVPHE